MVKLLNVILVMELTVYMLVFNIAIGDGYLDNLPDLYKLCIKSQKRFCKKFGYTYKCFTENDEIIQRYLGIYQNYYQLSKQTNLCYITDVLRLAILKEVNETCLYFDTDILILNSRKFNKSLLNNTNSISIPNSGILSIIYKQCYDSLLDDMLNGFFAFNNVKSDITYTKSVKRYHFDSCAHFNDYTNKPIYICNSISDIKNTDFYYLINSKKIHRIYNIYRNLSFSEMDTELSNELILLNENKNINFLEKR